MGMQQPNAEAPIDLCDSENEGLGNCRAVAPPMCPPLVRPQASGAAQGAVGAGRGTVLHGANADDDPAAEALLPAEGLTPAGATLWQPQPGGGPEGELGGLLVGEMGGGDGEGAMPGPDSYLVECKLTTSGAVQLHRCAWLTWSTWPAELASLHFEHPARGRPQLATVGRTATYLAPWHLFAAGWWHLVRCFLLIACTGGPAVITTASLHAWLRPL